MSGSGEEGCIDEGGVERYFTRIAELVRIPNLTDSQVVFGRDYAKTDGAHAQSLRARDASFAWLAYAFGDIPMSMLHVGVVIDGEVASAGIHVHESASAELAEAALLAAGESWKSKKSELAKEVQFDEVFDVNEANLIRISEFLTKNYDRTLSVLKDRGLLTP
jgi:hypothetical protein